MRVFLVLLLFIFGAEGQSSQLSSTEELNLLKTCPFPMAKTIQPCSCKVDEKYRIILICNIDQDMDKSIMTRVADAFGCKKEVHILDINLNGHNWIAGFNPELLGQFKISNFHLSNF